MVVVVVVVVVVVPGYIFFITNLNLNFEHYMWQNFSCQLESRRVGSGRVG